MRITFIGASDFCGEPWGPPSVGRGIPGTEEAFIHMSRRLAERGHAVSVYVHAGSFAGRYGAVEWCDLRSLPARLDTDVVVTTDLSGVTALDGCRLIYYWLHGDVTNLARSALDRIHKFMALSHSSRDNYAAIPDDKFFITRNGIDPATFERPVPRSPFKLVYGSDYDRGLIQLLGAWPHIREAHPDAELSVFYGWHIFDRKIELYGQADPENGRRWTALKTQIQAGLEQPGVTHLGRIDHDRVAEEFLSAAVWAYPCTFPETSCITAMKAQVAGAIPVVYATAALQETVRWGLRAPGYTPGQAAAEGRQVLAAWTDALIGLLGDPGLQNRIRPAMIADCRQHFAWERVAAEWEVEFAQELAR